MIGQRQRVGAGRLCRRPERLRRKPSPTLAQFAIRQARQLARNICLRIAGPPTRPFNFRTSGLFAAIGQRNAVGQVLGFTFAGFFAWVMWRGINLSKMPTLARKVQVAFDWAWDLLFFRGTFAKSAPARRPYPAGAFRARGRSLPAGRAGREILRHRKGDRRHVQRG